MSNKKGFTLIEIVIVLVIVGVLAVIAIPNYFNLLNQGAAKAAQNNLISIYNAQKTNYLSATGNGTYCISTGPPGHDCSNVAAINTDLSLNIVDNNFTYNCQQGGAPDNGFKCIATNTSGSGITLTLNNNPVVLLGGTNCATTSGTNCNPSCTPAASYYCPGS